MFGSKVSLYSDWATFPSFFSIWNSSKKGTTKVFVTEWNKSVVINAKTFYRNTWEMFNRKSPWKWRGKWVRACASESECVFMCGFLVASDYIDLHYNSIIISRSLSTINTSAAQNGSASRIIIYMLCISLPPTLTFRPTRCLLLLCVYAVRVKWMRCSTSCFEFLT